MICPNKHALLKLDNRMVTTDRTVLHYLNHPRLKHQQPTAPVSLLQCHDFLDRTRLVLLDRDAASGLAALAGALALVLHTATTAEAVVDALCTLSVYIG